VAELVEEAEREVVVAGRRVQGAVGGAEDERVAVYERRQLVRSAADVARLADEVPDDLVLHAQVVLVVVGRAQVRVYEEDAAAAEGQESGCVEVNVARGRAGRERVRLPRVLERVREDVGPRRVEEYIGEAEGESPAPRP